MTETENRRPLTDSERRSIKRITTMRPETIERRAADRQTTQSANRKDLLARLREAADRQANTTMKGFYEEMVAELLEKNPDLK